MKLQLFYCYSRSHHPLLDRYFLPSLPSSFEPRGFFCPVEGTGDFYAPDFLECVTFKVRQILRTLEENAGELIVWSDIDILFFADPVPGLTQALSSGQTDLVFQREGHVVPDVNTGFFAGRATPEARRFFERMLARMGCPPAINDQAAANELLFRDAGAGVSWDYLPWPYYARTHGWPPPRNAILYHANQTGGADGLGQKIRQFEEIRWVRRWGAPACWWSCARRLPEKVKQMLGRRK